MDIVAVSPTEVIRSRGISKVAEHWNSELALALALEVGPLDMRRGVNTEVKPSKVPENPLPLLHGPGDGRASADGVAPQEYAQQHPQEDLEDEDEPEQSRSSQEGGAVVESQAMEDEGAQMARD